MDKNFKLIGNGWVGWEQYCLVKIKILLKSKKFKLCIWGLRVI